MRPRFAPLPCFASASAALIAVAVLTTACGSSGSGDDASANGQAGAGGSPTGAGGAGSCGDPSTFVAPDAKHVVYAITNDADTVYFARQDEGIYSVPKTGGTPTLLAPTVGLHLYASLLVDDAALYYADQNVVYSVPKKGGNSVMLASGVKLVEGLAMDATSVYFGDEGATPGSGTVSSVPKGGGTATVLATNHMTPDSFVVDGDTLYWNDGVGLDAKLNAVYGEGLYAVPVAGGAERTVVATMHGKAGDALGGFGIAVDDTYIYYGDADLDAVSVSGMYRTRKDGSGTPERFSDLNTASAFLDGGFLYVANGNLIAKLSTADGTRTDLICFPDALTGSITMTHDAKAFYFAKDDGDAMHSVKTAAR